MPRIMLYCEMNIKNEVIIMVFETQRLIIRELNHNDFDSLYEILSDEDTMKHYPSVFDKAKVERWINWSIENYKTFGFGLWAVILKETGEMIGDCGITMQIINKKIKPEIGYHINKKYQNKGYATEAARGVRDYIFTNTTFNTLYTYMAYTNVASYTVALKNGMRFIEEYPDPDNEFTRVYAITREEWLNNKA